MYHAHFGNFLISKIYISEVRVINQNGLLKFIFQNKEEEKYVKLTILKFYFQRKRLQQ